jgi:hypothetical protein
MLSLNGTNKRDRSNFRVLVPFLGARAGEECTPSPAIGPYAWSMSASRRAGRGRYWERRKRTTQTGRRKRDRSNFRVLSPFLGARAGEVWTPSPAIGRILGLCRRAKALAAGDSATDGFQFPFRLRGKRPADRAVGGAGSLRGSGGADFLRRLGDDLGFPGLEAGGLSVLRRRTFGKGQGELGGIRTKRFAPGTRATHCSGRDGNLLAPWPEEMKRRVAGLETE